MAYKVSISINAQLDVEKAIIYYKEINIQLARDFLNELRITKSYIQKYPRKIQVRYFKIRVAFLKRYPFGVHFIFENETVIILSVLHTAKDNKEWQVK